MLRLTPPKHFVFFISVALAIIAVVLRIMLYTGTSMVPTGGFGVLLIAYLVLLAGNVFNRV
jgi:hypothetical protein